MVVYNAVSVPHPLLDLSADYTAKVSHVNPPRLPRTYGV